MLSYFFRLNLLTPFEVSNLLQTLSSSLNIKVSHLITEACFYVEHDGAFEGDELSRLRWLLAETFEPDGFSTESFLLRLKDDYKGHCYIIEVGPRLNFCTAWSSNAVSIFHACGLQKVSRIERARRYLFVTEDALNDEQLTALKSLLHDRMTECIYEATLRGFDTDIVPEPLYYVPVLEQGRSALEEINQKLGLGFDDWDLEYYTRLFKDELKRNPTNVECFDLSQSNSEHSRHWFFKGKLIIEGNPAPKTLMQIVKEPYLKNPNNSIIAFCDNSSAILGSRIHYLKPTEPYTSSTFTTSLALMHPLFTAETHNFPSAVAPFAGAETGTGGRIRDVHATGRGAHTIAGTAGYCVGNLFIENYPLPWEHGSLRYPKTLATPLQILIQASNGASDYGNKFGEPVIQGFARSFGIRMPDGERREWIKPIMFTGGVGQLDDRHIKKQPPKQGLLVVKIGGPAYRIGIGGGSASSMIQGQNDEALDFNAVQRGDAEMQQRLHRVIRACIELEDKNPILSIHDQGAGGNCNVVKEIVYPEGAKIDIRKIISGDKTLSVLELWGAEYQEQDAILIHPERLKDFEDICKREKLPMAVIGTVTGDGRLVLFDSQDGSIIEDLELKMVLGEMPQKVYHLDYKFIHCQPFATDSILLEDAINRVFRLVSVGSKRFLTNKVDRSVTGLIVRQQCVGPLQLPLADVAVVAQSYFDKTGIAISIGEQPIKGLIDPPAMARLSVTEALTNIVWAKLTALQDIRCSANWMWAPKLHAEGYRLYECAVAMSDFMCKLGIAVDGGKDSLSMAAKCPSVSGDEIVKSPGALVISAYALCPDIDKVITPDIKMPSQSVIVYIDLTKGQKRLGGSALAHCYKQVGDISPDIEDVDLLINAFETVQGLIDNGLILAGHDISDGGLFTALCEMAFAGNCGIEIDIYYKGSLIPYLFAEEPGLLIECAFKDLKRLEEALDDKAIPFSIIARTFTDQEIIIRQNSSIVYRASMPELRALWEETSFRLELLQANQGCVRQERNNIYNPKGLNYKCSFTPTATAEVILKSSPKPKVAILREEGSNGDREMAATFYQAGFEVWDVTMNDLLNDKVGLCEFKGLVFVGGFSYADVLDSAKGWAGCIKFNPRLQRQFDEFYQRHDTFSLGVCNGCQLSALLGWVPSKCSEPSKQPRFIKNISGRFESRFLAVKILPSPSIMLKGMEGSVLGIWVAHGEGRAYFPDSEILKEVLDRHLAPIRYVDDDMTETESYPFNPNGSPLGIAGLCSPDGRHLAMMPHPERTFLKYQWAWLPEHLRQSWQVSPWLRMFQNARTWCDGRL